MSSRVQGAAKMFEVPVGFPRDNSGLWAVYNLQCLKPPDPEL